MSKRKELLTALRSEIQWLARQLEKKRAKKAGKK